MKITFVDRSLVSEGDGVLPLTQLETMVKNEEFNTENFSCDPASLVNFQLYNGVNKLHFR
jgi:hypothetical protein